MERKNSSKTKYFVFILFYMATFFIALSSLTSSGNKHSESHTSNIILIILFIPILTRYLINVFISPLSDALAKFSEKKFKRISYTPKVSVVIPAWNEDVGIISTIASVLGNSYENFEIIIVNDGSTDSTDSVIRDYLVKNPEINNIRYVNKENGGKASALNSGVKKASGDLIITIDADSVMDKNAIASFVKYFKDPRVMAAAGNVRIGNSGTLIGSIQHLEYIYGFYFKKADSLMNSIYIVGGAAAAYRKQVFEFFGYFDTDTITEDIEMSTRIQSQGQKIVYAKDAIIYTEGASDLRSLIKQRLRWKRGRFETFYKYRRLFFSTSAEHNKILSWFILPLAFFAEILLFFEAFLLVFLYTNAIYYHNFSQLLLSIIILSMVITMQIITEDKKIRKYRYIIYAPIGWLIFYIVDFIEYNALLRSIWSIIRKKKVEWQKWQRVGLN